MNIVILTNDHLWTYNLRKELIEAFIEKGHKVTLVLPYGERIEYFIQAGCNFIDFPFEGQSINPVKEMSLYRKYIKVLKKLKPDLVFTYTTKPNIFGAMACARLKIPYVITITGVGRAMMGGLSKKIMTVLYRISARKAFSVMFQNKENMQMFKNDKIYKGNCVLVPGSGVNTDYHSFRQYPGKDITKFLFIGRLNEVKGIKQYLEAAEKVKEKHGDVEFHIVGMAENEAYARMVEIAQAKGTVIYHGTLLDVRNMIAECHCTILPSYSEGMANVLLESASAGRPLIATDISGCRETITNGETGFIFKVGSTDDLIAKILKFLNLTYEEKEKMGVAGRNKIMKEFDRKIVAEKYMEIIDKTQNPKG